jgi:hypothetical protein
MSKVLTAEYDDTTNSLHLLEPVEGIADHQLVSVIIGQTKPKRPWSHLENVLKGENAESFGRAIDEAYPIEPVEK